MSGITLATCKPNRVFGNIATPVPPVPPVPPKPTCRCGRSMLKYYSLYDGDSITTTWRCQARRWWNGWLHPHQHSTEEV